MSGYPIGGLRHRIVLEIPVRTAAEGGGATITWQVAGAVFARIEAASGREIGLADGISARVSHAVVMRYRDDVTPQMRILEGARILEIRAVLDDDGRQRWLRCLCEERLP